MMEVNYLSYQYLVREDLILSILKLHIVLLTFYHHSIQPISLSGDNPSALVILSLLSVLHEHLSIR